MIQPKEKQENTVTLRLVMTYRIVLSQIPMLRRDRSRPLDDPPQTTHSYSKRAEIAASLTASALVFLFADQFVGPPPRHLMGIEVPCRAIKVHALSLAAVLCATALWSLREQGLVALNIVKRRRAFVFQWNELSVLQLDTDQRVGVEGVMMGYLPEPIGRTSLTYQWSHVVQAAVNEVVTVRCLEQREVPDYTGMWPGSLVIPNCARIATFTQAAHDIAARWQHFQVSERRLYEVLMKECWNGVQPYDPTWRPERW